MEICRKWNNSFSLAWACLAESVSLTQQPCGEHSNKRNDTWRGCTHDGVSGQLSFAQLPLERGLNSGAARFLFSCAPTIAPQPSSKVGETQLVQNEHEHCIVWPMSVFQCAFCASRFPDDANTWAIDRQLLWGSALLISPVLEEVFFFVLIRKKFN